MARLGDQAVQYGSQFVGKPYIWGGQSPSGFDCSGFTSYVYKKLGLAIPRTSAAQYAWAGKNKKLINEKQLQPGDLVFYGKGKVTDVKMYIGGGKIMGASGGPLKGGGSYGNVIKGKGVHYRSDVIGYAAVGRSVSNVNIPGAQVQKPNVPVNPNNVIPAAKDPNALGTNKMQRKMELRQMVLSQLNFPQPDNWLDKQLDFNKNDFFQKFDSIGVA